MPKIEIKPNADFTEVAIDIDGVPFASANASQLDSIIEGLVVARSQMKPQHPTQPPIGQRVSTVDDPHYWTNHDPERGMTLLMFRHPGLGWLSFMLPPAERDRLAQYLVELSKLDPQTAVVVQKPSTH